MFVLVPRVTLRMRVNVARAAESRTRRLPVLIRRQVQSRWGSERCEGKKQSIRLGDQ